MPNVAISSILLPSGTLNTKSLSAFAYSAKLPLSGYNPPCTVPATLSPTLILGFANEEPMETTVPDRSQPIIAPGGEKKAECFQSVGF